MCFENHCTKHPSYNFEGKNAIYCSKHKKEGMIDVISKRCNIQGCYTIFDYFSIKNKEVAQYKGSNIRPSLTYIHIGDSLEELNRGLREILEKI
jgi:hypothetical protein